MTTTYPPVIAAHKAVERELVRYAVGVLRHGVSSALHQVEYELDGRTIAVIGWTDELIFVRFPAPQVVALLKAHHALEVAQ